MKPKQLKLLIYSCGIGLIFGLISTVRLGIYSIVVTVPLGVLVGFGIVKDEEE